MHTLRSKKITSSSRFVLLTKTDSLVLNALVDVLKANKVQADSATQLDCCCSWFPCSGAATGFLRVKVTWS